MIIENNNILEKTLEQVRVSGILSEGDYDRYLKDILTSVLGFVYKVKIKMITSDMSFFTDYYLPSNCRMTNFKETDARYVFKILMDHFLKKQRMILLSHQEIGIQFIKYKNAILDVFYSPMKT